MPFPTYDKKADIPAGAEDVYEEKDGKFVPKVPDTSKLEETLTKVRGEKSQAEKDLKSAREAAATAQRELDAVKASGGDIESKTKELLAKWQREKDEAVAEVQGRLDAANSKLRGLLVDGKAKEAFIAAGGNPKKADAALKLNADKLDLGDDDALIVKDEKGQPSTIKIEDYFGKTFKESMPELYTGTQGNGGGAGGVAGSGAGGSKLTADQIMANPGLAFEAPAS